jgi:exopolysaccharide biosynthesis polyprenyl glycosylphosphotransferase
MEVQLRSIPLIQSASSCPEAPALSLKHQRLILKACLILSDVLALGLAFGLAYWMRFNLQVTVSPDVLPDPKFYPSLAALLIPVSILVFLTFRLYEPHVLLGGVSEYSRVFNACTTGTMMVVLATFFIPEFAVSRLWLVSAWLLSLVMVLLNRFLCRRFAYALRRRGYLLTPAVIIGTNDEATTLAADLGDWQASGLRVVGHVSSEDVGEMSDSVELPVLGSTGEIRRILREYEVEDLVVAITALSREELLRLCEEVNSVRGVHLRLSSGLYELLTTRVSVRTLGPVPLVSLNKIRLEQEEIFIKTVLEYSLVIVSLLVLLPLLLILAVLIRLDSPGPAIHRRRVLGVSGRQFNAFKFRTMVTNGDDLLKGRPELVEHLLAHHKLKQDPRITRVGRWLRKYSLDELPQLFNVLLGQMSLVGPRMIAPEEAAKYGRHKLNLLTVKPGITGLWQVSGRSDLSYDERVRLDMCYVRNYSVWLDLQILFVQTLPAVFKGRGAY